MELLLLLALVGILFKIKGSGPGVIGINHNKPESLDFKPGDKIKFDPALGLVKIPEDPNGE